MNYREILNMLSVAVVLFAACQQKDAPQHTLKVDPEELSLKNIDAKDAFSVYSSQDWSLQCDAAWLTVNPSSGEASTEGISIALEAEDNISSQVRSAVITITAGSLQKTIKVTQSQDTAVPEGKGTESDPYVLKTVENMKKMNELVQSGQSVWFKLANDIDMASVEDWTPVNSDPAVSCQIYFDGNGKKLSNFSSNGGNCPSLFGYFYGKCHDLEIEGASVTSFANPVGVLAKQMGSDDIHAECVNVHVSATLSANGTDKIGGFAGMVSNAEFTDCSADLTIDASKAKYVGGIVGVATGGTVKIAGCSVNGNISAHSYIGGLIGGQDSPATVTLESSNSSATITGQHHYTAGLAGYMNNGENSPLKITDCYATGPVTSKGSSCSPLVAFVANGCEITDCHATGSISAVNNVGGILAWATGGSGKAVIRNCWYDGNINGAMSVAGIVGYSEGTIEIERCHVTGSVISSGTNCGGILGQKSEGGASVSECYFSGLLEGAGRVGGIVSYLNTGTAAVSNCWSEGRMVTTANALGGIVAHSNINVSISNCSSTAELMGYYCQAAGGILGIAAKDVLIEDCYAAGEVHAMRGAGGIVGMLNGVTNAKIITAIAWNPRVRAPRQSNANYSSGAIIGCVKGTATLTDNFYRADLELLDPFIPEMIQHENVTNSLPPLPEGISDVNQCAYNGKAAPAGISLGVLAKNLGWDENAWNLPSDGADNGVTIKPLDNNKIDF